MAKKKSPETADSSAVERFQRRRAWFNLEWSRQEANRYQMALDEDYYDSIQWTPDEARAVRLRGQNPIVYNEVKPTIDWLIGTQRRMRRDFRVLSRNSDAEDATADAEVKTQLLKYLDDVNRAPFTRSAVFDDKVKAGLGWLEVGISADPEDELIYTRYESWRNVLHDSMAPTNNVNDGRFLFRFREVDLDVAQAFFPQKAKALERASNAGLGTDPENGWADAFPTNGLNGTDDMPAKYIQFNADAWINNPRKRVLLIECWNFEPTRETTGGGASSLDRVKMVMHCSIMTKLETIVETTSPYKHNKFPFVPNWCYRRKRDGAPYGVVRPIRGPQDGLNKRMSKSQFEAASNQLQIEEGAINNEIMDVEEIREEINSPDGIAIFANGAISGGKVRALDRRAEASAQLQLAEMDRMTIRGASGVSMEMRGATSNVTSGKGIIAKQEQGGLLTAEIFDNDLLAHQLEGDLIVALIEQFYTEEKTFSVTGERFKLDYVTLNKTDPVTGEVLNDVTRHKAVFVIGEAPWRQALAEAAFESAMQMLGQLAPVAPQIVTAIIDLVFEWSDLPNKGEILRRIRQATGQADPDSKETPEQQEQAKKKVELANAQFEAEMANLQATVKEAQARGEKLDAEGMAKRLETVYMAAQAAQVAVQVPGAMPVADQLLASVGFVDASGQGTGAVVPPMQQALPPEPPPMDQPAQMTDQMADQIPELQQADGAQAGIQTPQADGVINPQEPMA